MKTLTALRAARLLRQESLATTAKAVQSTRAHLSSVERDCDLAGRKLVRRLEAHFGAPFHSLEQVVDGDKLASALLENLTGSTKNV